MRRRTLFAGAAGIGAALAIPGGTGHAATTHGTPVFPDVIDLPDGFQPEGIAISGTTFYVGSLVDGAVYRGSLITGKGSILVPGRSGGQATGIKVDTRGRLWVCGAGTGGASVYDARTGRTLAQYDLGGSFVNDVVLTPNGAYLTDSDRPVLYRLPLNLGAAHTIDLTGGLGETGAFNNGIEVTADGRLVIVQMLADRLFSYDPRSGATFQYDLGGATVLQGDGLLRRGPYLYVVRNSFNVIAKFRLHRTSAELVAEITDPRLQVPATIADFGGWIYAVNARFDLPAPAPTDTYTIVKLPT
ncbi:superoxide dismutase [Dactylosporangium vinaceum]|uniref:SMP-30/gluconolactonase/LRE family protein n=1 Tax=Dactylosporangium vinaceum TaxID=53362 RepID=A0ABV5M5K2_9ACTN|nr:SMP-30/gluconolactonase/LRE family protein [Dactylosporangium vinaceum]UAB95554.1 superoxide dismutase [Dactylosporangium vinaceum]